jgi:hypothetical protein
MNSSVDATQYENTARNRSGYRDNQCQFGLECKLNAIDPHQPATCFGTSWASDPGADPVRQRKFYAMEFTGDQKLPPLIQADAYRDDEPQVVRFVEGDDVPARRRALENCMRQLGAARGRKLLLRCRQGELETQLGFARGWAEERRAWFPARPVVVGIDGIDQWLVSAPVAASQLQAIVNGGATVACGVDARYRDSRFLEFQLRTLGITVIHEAAVPGRRFGSCAPGQSFTPEAGSGGSARHAAHVRVPVTAAQAALHKNRGAPASPDFPPDQGALKPLGGIGGAAGSAVGQSERLDYARAYRDKFALNRLLRERFGLQS